MDYRLELLHADDFEGLTNTICQKLFGMGVVTFSTGKDGGRDGKFAGTANKYPSETAQWTGNFIVQAKHTANHSASCADNEFHSLLQKEIPKIKKLKANGDIDNWIIFTNRKYSAITGEALLKKLKKDTGLDNIVIFGKEHLNNHLINPNRDIIKQYKLDQLHIPFDFSDEEIKEIILAFKSHLKNMDAELLAKVEQVKYDFTIIDIKAKNKKNGLGDEYHKNEIMASSLMEFEKIQHFLNAPINSELKEYYFDIAAELSQIITIKRDNFDAFEEIFHFIYQRVCDGEIALKGSKRHITTFLHYMYFECLIGKK